MKHYVEKVQQPEFAAAKDGYTFVSHQQEVGTGYFDKVTTIIQGGASVSHGVNRLYRRRSVLIFPLSLSGGGMRVEGKR